MFITILWNNAVFAIPWSIGLESEEVWL